MIKPDIKKAVALQYDMESKYGAPKILTSGKGEIAKEIISRAEEYDIPLFKNPELASSLLNLEIGKEIPPELFKAVSEVFVWLMKQEKH
jgi:flagellar biosynthesis protein